MSEPYVGQIILFAGNRAPDGWAFCDGRQLPSADFPALFQTIGTTYGGDGQSTFALPDLRGRVPLGDNAKYPIGTMLGQEDVTLTGQQIAPHSHPAFAGSQQGNANVPVSNTLIAPLGDNGPS